MRHNLEVKDSGPSLRMRQLVEESIARLDRLVPTFPSEAVFLRVFVEKNATRALHRVSLTLDVPGGTLATQEERHDAEEAIREAFAEIERQLIRHKDRLANSDVYKRRERRENLRRKKVEAIPTVERRHELFSALLEQHLQALYNFTRREIAYRVAIGDLLPDEVTADDVVAAVVPRAYREFVKDLAKQEIKGWLIGLALDEIEAEVARSRRAREGMVRTEEDIPETPPTEAVSTLGDEVLDFHQPDEDLRLEDVIARPFAPTPEEVLESRELQRDIARTLATLPRVSRLAFVLRYVEGLPLAEVARITRRSQSETARNLEHARKAVRQRLIQLGLPPQDKAAQTVFGTAADVVDVPTPLRRALREKVGIS
jgi:ribosomal subunit interface protein